MAHLHEKIDFTVAILVVEGDRVLVVHHRKLNRWLPLGGHIELDEDPEQAAVREAREECGLEVALLGDRPPTTEPGTRALVAPRFLDIHRIHATHEHIGMIYFARPVGGTLALEAAEHHDLRWCTAEELDRLEPPMTDAVKWYCRQALREAPTLPMAPPAVEAGPGMAPGGASAPPGGQDARGGGEAAGVAAERGLGGVR